MRHETDDAADDFDAEEALCEMYGDDDDAELPQDDDWTTDDFRTFRRVGSSFDVITVPEGQTWERVMSRRMDDDGYYPNVWRVSDHGDVELVEWERVESTPVPDWATGTGHDIAKRFGCEYTGTGDASPVPHGGLWYSTADWADGDYADAVEVTRIEGWMLAERGTINRPDDMAAALRCIGLCEDTLAAMDPAARTAAEIEAARAWGGMEVDDAQWFDVEDEGDLWNHIAPWLEALRPAD